MDDVSHGDLANPANLRAFIDATSHMTGTSALAVLGAMTLMLERQLRRQSDDIKEVRRLGRLLQVVRGESDSGLHGRARS
jgi:hypothetical protein